MPYQNQDPDVAAQEAQQGNTASDPDQNQALNAPTQAPQATLQDDGAIANQAGSAPQDDGSIANQAQPAQPIQQHHRFADMLAHLTGNQQTPVLDAQGRAIYDSQTGQVHTRKATVRDLGASILAGALSSLATSFANQPYRNGNGEWINPVNKNMQEQGEIGQRNSLQGRVQQAQQVSDQTRMRQYSTYEQNLKLMQLQHAVTREGDEAIQRNATYFKPLHDFVLNDPLLKGSIAEGGEDAGEKEVAAFMRKGHSPGEFTAIPSGVRPSFDENGKPTGGLEQTFTVIHNGGRVELTQALAQEYGYPQSAVGQTITLNQLMVHGIGNATEGSIGNALTSLNAKNKALNPESKDVTMADIRQNVPSSRNATILGQINTAMDSSLYPDQVLAEIRKVSPEAASFLQSKWQTDETTYKAHRDKIDAAAKREADPDKVTADPEKITSASSDMQTLLHLNAGQAKILAKELNPKSTIADYKAVMTKAMQVSEANDRLALAKSNAAAKGASTDDVDILSDQLLEPNNLMAMKDIGGRGNQKIQIIAAAVRKAKERGIPFDPGVINQRVKFLGEYEDPKGRASTNRQAINNVLQHAGDLSDLNEMNRRSNIKILNTPINALKDQFGDQTFTQYQTASGVLKDELSLYFAGGYAPSKDQQDMWNKIQSDTATPAQTEAFAKEVVRLAARRANTFNEQFKTNMGYSDPNMITPAAKAAAEHLGMGSEVAQFGSGGKLGDRPAAQQTQPNAQTKSKALKAVKDLPDAN